QNAFVVGVFFNFYTLHRSVGNTLCPYPLGFDGGLKKSLINVLHPIIPHNACILYLITTIGTKLANAYSSYIIIICFLKKRVYNLVVNHSFRPATNRHLGKPLPHRLVNRMQAPPWVDSSFCSSAYGVLITVSNCCPPPNGKFLCITHLSATENTTRML
ncbi:hypothetical protein CY35_12G067400, partial [Sphagnum magellanicum]